ncbi:MAG: YbaK/EbsC family protein [Planctomycetota bacterium]
MDAFDSQAPGPVFLQLVERLRAAGIEFRHLHHAPVYTSAEAAAVRGVALHSGAKALILKAGDAFVMAVLPADCGLDSGALRRLLNSKHMRFATKEEVLEVTGLTPGSIPPFGSLFDLPTLCDTGLADNERINFNAGSHADSVQMRYVDYLALESPRLAVFAKAASGTDGSPVR